MPGFGGPVSTSIPPPAPLYPGLNSAFLSLLSNYGGGALGTLGNAASGGNNNLFSQAFQTLVTAQQPLVQAGQSAISEQFGSSGLAYSSPLMNSLSQYQTNTQNSFLNTLANYQLQSTGQQLGASEFLSGLYGNTASTLYPTSALGTGSNIGSQLVGTAAGFGSSAGLLALMSAMGLI